MGNNFYTIRIAKFAPWVLLVILIISIAYIAKAFEQSELQYVRGKYGTVCYIRQFQPKSIQYPVYFKSIEDCAASL